MRILKTAAVIGATLLSATAANAATVQSFDSGWYQDNGFTAGVNNINVGSNSNTGAFYNNWLAFNLAGLSNQVITSATVTFYGGNGVNTSSTAETLALYDYTGSINALLANSQFNTGIYNDLGTGSSYGSATVASGAISQFSITLSAAAIANLNAAAQGSDTRFVIGGTLASVVDRWSNEQLFAIFGPQQALNPAAFLTLETSAVPEPASWAMMIAGFGAIGAVSRRKQAAKLRFA